MIRVVFSRIDCFLKQAPFNKRELQLVPAVGSCVECPKRNDHNKLLFADVSGNTNACTGPQLLHCQTGHACKSHSLHAP